MAKTKIKTCESCLRAFKGRADARTCSARCRKRLQRTALTVAETAAKEVESIERKIEQAAKEAESLIRPTYATEEGFISVAEPATPVTTDNRLETNPENIVDTRIEQPSLAYSTLPATPLGSQYDSSELDSEPFIPDANRPGMDYRPAPFWHLFSFSGRFVIGTLAVIIVAAALLVLVDRPKAPQPVATSLDNQQTVIGSTTVGDHILRINFDTQLTNGKQLTATGPVVIQNQTDSTGALKVQAADGSNILVANTLDKTITIGDKPPGNVSLNVNGDITTNGSLVSTTNSYSLGSAGLTIGGVLVCTAHGCVSSSSPAPTPANPTIDVANLAYLNVNQTFSGQNGFNVTSANAFQIQNSSATDKLFMVDTTNNRIGIGTMPSASGATLQVAGDLNVSSGVYRIGNVAGANLTCGPNELLQQGVISGGIITSGSCVTVAGSSTPTLQQVYDASTPSSITLSNASGVFQIQDAASPLATDLFEVTNNGASTKYFAVNSLGISVTGNINTTGQYQIGGSQISSANLSDGAQLAKVGANNTFTGNNTFSSVSNSFNGDGSGLTNLNATNISSGTINNLRLSANVTLQGNSFNGASQLVQLTAGGILPILSGANLTNLNATNISSGTLDDLRLSANVAKLASNQTFTGNNTFTLSSTALTVQDASSPLGADLFAVTDNSGSTKYFEVSATTAKVNGNDICTSAGNCVGVSGGSIGGSGTAGKLAEFTGSGFTIGDSPITDSGSALTLGEDTTINGTLGVNTISPTATMTVGVASQALTLQGDASTSLSATSSGITNSLVFATPVSSGKTITLPNASGTVAVSASGPLALDAAGNLTCPTCLTSGGGGGTAGVSSINTQTGAITLAGTPNQVTITASGGPTLTFSTPQDINTSSSPTFANINLGSGGVYEINGSQISSTALSNDSNLAKLNTTQTFIGANTSAPTTDITGFTLKQTSAASPTSDVFDVTNSSGATKYLAVDSSGNVSASGTFNATVLQQAGTNALLETTAFGGSGGDITGTYDNLTIGTGAVTSAKILDGTIADVDISNTAAIAYGKLNLSNSIINSDIAAAANISDSKLATITSAGKVADSALSSNVALLNANQTFSGNNTYTGTVAINKTNTSAFQIQNASTPDNLFIADTSNHRIAIDQATAAYALDVAGDINTTTGYRVSGTPGSGITCSSGNVIQNATVSGGIITGGSCVANGAGATTTLAQAYGNGGASTDQTLALATAKGGGLVIQDASSTVGNLLSVENNMLNVSYLNVTNAGINVNGTIQTNSTNRVDNSGNLVNIGNFTASAGSTFSTTGANGFTFKPGTDNTTAFQIQNAAGTSTLLGIDTTDSNISLGKLTSGALAAWSTNANSLPASRENAATVVANGYVYEMGGCTGSPCTTQTPTVYYAKLNADGSTGSWITNANALLTAMSQATSVTYNGYIYVLGGYDGTNPLSSVYYAKLNSDGSIGSWNTNVNTITAARNLASSVVYNGYIYVIGGSNPGTPQTTVYYAKLNADGSTGAWQTNTNALPAARRLAGSAVFNGYVYIVAGDNSGAGTNTTYYAKLNTDGSTGAWQTNTNNLPQSIEGNASAVINGYLYSTAGQVVGTGNLSNTYYAKLNSDGSTGAWQTNTNNLPQALTKHNTVANNGYIYVIGGDNGSSISSVYYASVQGMARNSGQESINDQLTVGNGLTVTGNISLQSAVDSTSLFNLQNATSGNLINVDSVNSAIALDGNNSGQLSYWATNTNSLPVQDRDATSVVANGYIYEIGGNSGNTNIYYAKINADGSLGTWTTNTNALPKVTRNATSVTANGYIYVMGGTDGSNVFATVYYAQLNANGSTGTWQINANPLPQTLLYATSVTANGYIYEIGGCNAISCGSQSTVYYAKLNADGSTGAWSTNNNALPANRSDASSVVANGYVYVLGGDNGGAVAQNTIYYASLNSSGSTSGWTSTSLPAARNFATSVASNDYLYEIGGCSVNACPTHAQSTVYFTKLNNDGSISSNWQTNANALPDTVQEATSVVANGYVYEIGGYDNTSNPLNTIYYASTSRIQIGANLDLVGLQGGTLADAGNIGAGSTGGSITAGNGIFVGGLQVQGAGSFAQSVSIGGNLTNSGSALFQSSTGLTNAFQVQSTTGSQAINVSTVTTPNLISNGDFESTTNGWSGKGSATITRNDSNPSGYSGIGDLKISTTAAANDGASFNYTFAASIQYTLSLYARSTSGTVSTINIGHQDVSGTDINCLTGQSITTTWTRFTCTFSTGGTITPPTQIYIKQTDATARTFYIDGVQLEQAGSASAFQASQANVQVQTATNTVTLDGSDSGALGPWATSTNSLPAARECLSSVTANSYVYAIGGNSSTNCGTNASTQSSVYYAKINSDGSIGTWNTNTNSLPNARQMATAVVANGYIYEIAGIDTSGTPQATVYYARLNSDGSTGAWTTSSNPVPQGLESPSSVVANGYLYVLNGYNGTSNQTTVYYAKLNPDGSTGTWTTNANPTPGSTFGAASVVASGYVYVMGGNISQTTYYAKLNADGSTGTWGSQSNLPASTTWASSFVSNGNVYYLGTSNVNAYYARLNNDGSTGSWTTNSNSLPMNIGRAGIVAINGYAYIIGGFTTGGAAQSAVYYASTPRIQIGSNLDLVGLQGGTLADDGGQPSGSVGGSITAGNALFVGSLQVQGAVNFAQGANIVGNFTVSSSTGITLLTADPGNQIITINGALMVAGNITISSGALITSSTGMYGTSLPGSPVNGQEFYYEADPTNGVVWHLRYDSSLRSGAGAWVFLGGSPLLNTTSSLGTTASTSYADLSTGAISITAPLNGTYQVSGNADALAQTASGDDAYMGIGVGNFSTAQPIEGVAGLSGNSGQNNREHISTSGELSGVTSSSLIKERYKTDLGNSVGFQNISLLVTPVIVY